MNVTSLEIKRDWRERGGGWLRNICDISDETVEILNIREWNFILQRKRDKCSEILLSFPSVSFMLVTTSRRISSNDVSKRTCFFFLFSFILDFQLPSFDEKNWNSTFVRLVYSSSTAHHVSALTISCTARKLTENRMVTIKSSLRTWNARKRDENEVHNAALLHISEGRYIQLAFATTAETKARRVGKIAWEIHNISLPVSFFLFFSFSTMLQQLPFTL